MNKIPTEILSIIFEAYTASDQSLEHGGLGGSPRILALVNRRWYYTAFGTPSLWRTILITDNTYNYWFIQRVAQSHGESESKDLTGTTTEHSAIQICGNPSQLAHTLQRAAASALDLTFYWGYASDRALCSQFYKAIFNETVGPYISILLLEDAASWMMDGLHSKHPLGVEYSFVRLVRLRVANFSTRFPPTDASLFIQMVLEQAPNLAEIAFTGYSPIPECLKLNVWKNSSYRSTIQNLKRLTTPSCVDVIKIYGTEVHARELVLYDATLFEVPDYPYLWKSSSPFWPRHSTPQTTFTYLTTLHLILDELCHISSLYLPLLESLRITQSSPDRQMIINWALPVVAHFTTDFPKLKSLHVTSVCIAPLIYFYTPHLECLHLTSMLSVENKAEADFMSLFPSAEETMQGAEGPEPGVFTACLTNIVTLHLSADVPNYCIIQALRLLPSLRDLTLVPGMELHLMLVQALTLRRVDDAMGADANGTSTLLCLELRVFLLNLHEFSWWNISGEKQRVGTITPAGLPAALRKLVESRKQGDGQALDRLTVIARDGSRSEYA